MNPFERRLLETASLPTLPAVARRILELVRTDRSDRRDRADRRDRSDLRQLVAAIDGDSPLSARVLALLNSPRYRSGRELRSLREAVLYLGPNAVRCVALAFSLASTLRGSDDGLDELRGTWLMTALAARRLSEETGGWEPEEAFLSGLLEFCGAPLLSRLVTGYSAVLRRFRMGAGDLLDLERATLETDHARVAELLLQRWDFPRAFVVVIAAQREIAAQRDPSLFESGSTDALRARILHAGWLCARTLTVPGFATEAPALEQHVSVLLGLASPVVRAIVAELPDELREFARLFEIPAHQQRSFEELLEEASRNEAAPVLGAGRPAGSSARRLSASGSERGRELAGALAGEGAGRVATRNSFELALELVHRRARELRGSLGLLVLDCSSAKLALEPVNAALEELLCEIAERASRAVRQTDCVGRLSASQLGVLLPGCPAEALRRTAARLQRAIECDPVETGMGPIDCRIHLGGVGSMPDRDGIEPHALLLLACSAADRSLSSPDRVVIGNRVPSVGSDSGHQP